MPMGTAASEGSSTAGPSSAMRSPLIIVVGGQFLLHDLAQGRGLPHGLREQGMGVGKRDDTPDESLVEIVDVEAERAVAPTTA